MKDTKRIIVFGATGKTGQPVWKKALEQGHQVTVFVRSPSKINCDNPNLKIVKGNVFSPEPVAAAIATHDTAIVCLGSIGLKDTNTLTTGTKHVINGMKQQGVKRLIAVSAAGVSESWQHIPLMSKILFKTLLRNIFADHHAQEALIKASGLDWTIARAAILKDNPETGNYKASNSIKTSSINRADVADFLVKQITDTNHIQQAISITA